MYPFIEHRGLPDPFYCRCNADIIVYAALLLMFLFALSYSKKLSTLLGRWAWGRSPLCPKLDLDLTETQTSTIASLHATAEEKDARIRTLERDLDVQTTRLERNLTESATECENIKLKANAEMAQMEKEMKTLSNDCRKFLDPHYEYPTSMSIALVANFGAARGRKLEREMQRREAALANGELGRELQKTKVAFCTEARGFKKVIREKERGIKDRDERIVQLEGEVEGQKDWIGTLVEQRGELVNAKMDLGRRLAGTSEALDEERVLRAELDKVVVQKDRKLEAAEGESFVLATQLEEAAVAIAMQDSKLNVACDMYEILQRHTRAAELRADNLRHKVDVVRSGYNRLSKVLNKLNDPYHRHWSHIRQAMHIKSQLELEFGPGEVQDQIFACNHKDDLEAAAAREAEMACRVGQLESQITVLKKKQMIESVQPQPPYNHEENFKAAAAKEGKLAGRVKELESEVTVLRKELIESVQRQPSCNHEEELKTAAAKEMELTGRVGNLESETADLKKQLTAESNALHTIHNQAEALRNQMATELHAKDPDSVTLDDCVAQYQRLLEVANQSVQNQSNELSVLKKEQDTDRTRIRDINTGRDNIAKDLKKTQAGLEKLQTRVAADLTEIARQKELVTSGETECIQLRKEKEDDIAEIGRQIDMVASKEAEHLELEEQLTAKEAPAKSYKEEHEAETKAALLKKATELHLASYLSQENFDLPVVAAVMRDVFRARAIAEEHAAAPYDKKSMQALGQLVKCNDQIDKLRAILQDLEAQPTLADLRRILDDAYTDVDETEFKQAVPRLREQMVNVNTRVSELLNIVETKVASAARAALERAPKDDLNDTYNRMSDEVIDVSLREKMLDMLMEPRGDEHELDDVDMA